MDEDEKKQVVSALRATITSQKGGVELRVLNSDYRELEGENIPFRQCGFSSLEAYIRSLSNDFSIVPRDGSLYVIAKKTEALAHLQDLVSGQAKKKSSKKGGYKPRGKFTGGYNTAFNNRSGPPHRPAPRSSGPPCYNRNSSLQGRVPGGSRPQSYNTSKPRAASSGGGGGGGYYDRDQESRNNDWSAPSARQPSPVRRKSPPRERHEPTTSASRNREPAAQPAQKKREAPTPHPPPIIRKMPEHLQSPKPTPAPQVEPATSSRPLPRLLSQLAKEDSLNKANKESKMLNLQITLPNDYYVGPPATQAYQAPPMLPSHLYTSPPPKSPGPHTSLPASLVSPPLPPSLPSPSLSLLNGASSSKSSSPEVYIDLPAGASPEQQLSHLCRYLFSEEPDVQIKQRATDPRGKNFTFYAFIQVGVHPRISTLPNDYPSRDAAHSAVIQLALAQLTKLKDEKMAKALKKTTDKLNILIERIYSLVRHAHNGLVAAKVEEMYEEKYGEVLPAGWSQLAEVTQHPRLEVNSTPICTIVYAKTLQPESHSAGAPLPPLVLPEENEWPVFSSVMTSVCSVYVRLVNDSCNLFYKLSDDLDSFMSEPATKPAPVTQARPGQLCTLHDEECWHRVRVLEVRGERGNAALVRFIDHGEESEHPLEELYPLYDQFRTMPAQAIELFLPECQSFAELLDHHLVEAEIVGKPLVAVVDRQDHLPGETTYAATLYNTEQEPAVNVNHLVFQQICDLFNVSSLPDENMFKESVFVSYISSAESCVYVQVESLMFQYLQSSIAALVDSAGLEQHRVGLASALAACRAEVFLARYDSDGQYYRARLITVDPIGNKVTVRFIDYGNTSDVSCQNLIKLFETTHHSHLCLIPPQAKQVKLAGLEVFTPEVMTKLTTLLNGTEPVILKMSAGRAQIHKRDSQGKIVGINNLVLGSNGFKDPHLRSVPSKELDASPLDPPVTPPLNEFIDVLVESISSPTNFWIRPEESYNNWVEMMDEMDDYYSQKEKTLPPVAPEDIRVGACFVCPYEELDLWQRVTIHSRISPDSVALFLADLGKIITADTCRLRYLAPQFRQLPAIAIKAKLHDIKPAFVDWTPADIVRFQALCEGGGEGEGGGGGAKVLKCRVESITPDVLTHGGEHAVLSVRLLDSHGPKDIDLASCLVVEGRAKMAE